MKSSEDIETGIPEINKHQLFEMLLKELKINSQVLANYQHIIHIEDEEYGINGDYIFDYQKDENDQCSSYIHFMVPFKDYSIIFKNYSLPI